MFPDLGGELPGPHATGQLLGDAQRPLGVELNQVEIGILSGFADTHHHVGLLSLEEIQGVVDVLVRTQG